MKTRRLPAAVALALATVVPTGGAELARSHRLEAPNLLPPVYLYSSGRYDPAWWLRQGAASTQRQRRKQRRRGGR